MALINLLLSPGSAICRHYGIDPQSDAGLMRWQSDETAHRGCAL